MRVAAIVLLLVGLLWSVLVVWIFLTIASIAAFESLAPSRINLDWCGEIIHDLLYAAVSLNLLAVCIPPPSPSDTSKQCGCFIFPILFHS
jgi:hypothetical protein